jgi:hypothetical protein
VAISSYRLTDHARKAMVRRRISGEVVEEVLAAPEAVLDDQRPERRIYQATAEVGDPPLRVLVRVIVDVSVHPPAVITVYATTQFRRYGARQ